MQSKIVQLSKKPLVSYLIITHNRKDDLREVLLSILKQNYNSIEIIVVDNNSEDGTGELIREKFNFSNINYIKLKENKGVAGGRNVAIKNAKGKFLVTIDDDAIIKNVNVTNEIVEKFINNPDVGALAFKIINYFTGELQKSAFPIRGDTNSLNKEFEVVRFPGGGHAIPKHVYEKIGVYGDFFPYAHEELDLALRILDAGYKIIYFPKVTILHKVKCSRRVRQKGRWRIILKNRIKVTVRNLPVRFILSTALLWSFRTLVDTRGNFRPIIQAWWELFKERKILKKERRVIKQETILRIKKLKGPLWY